MSEPGALGAGGGDDVALRLLRTWAHDAARLNEVLARHDPAWGSETHQVAGGWLVLGGPGLYVNRAAAAGIDPSLTDADVAFVAARCADVGVPAAFEVSPLTSTATHAVLTAHHFSPDPDLAVTAHVWRLARLLPDSPTDIVIRSISASSIGDWQDVAAIGWGHESIDARRASDAFTRAAHVIDGDGMVIAHDARDGRPLGCASLTRNGGVATLGGMSTIPAERRRGVQAALVRHRIEAALDSGCDLITTSTQAGGASERNVGRLGFEPLLTITTWRQSTSG